MTLRAPGLIAILLSLSLSATARAQCQLEGVVRTATGIGLGGAIVQVLSPGLDETRSATTEADGRYVVPQLPPGIWVEIRVFLEGRRVARTFSLVTSRIERLDIKTERDSAIPASAADLDPMGGSAGVIRGVVRAGDGTSLAGARVFVGDIGVGTTTDADGRYSFAPMRSGLSIDLRVSATGFEATNREVRVPGDGSSAADFVLAAVPASAADRVAAPDVTALEPSALPGRSRAPGDIVSTAGGFTWYPFARRAAGLTPVDTEVPRSILVPAEHFAPSGPTSLASALMARPPARSTAGPGGSIEAGLLGWAADVRGPIGRTVSVRFAGRGSSPAALYGRLLDAYAAPGMLPVRDRAPRFSGGVLATPSPQGFHDLAAAVTMTPGGNDRLAVTLYSARDDNNASRDQPLPPSDALAIPAPDQLPADAVLQVGDAGLWKGRGGSASWTRRWTDAFSTTATFGRSQVSWQRDVGFFLTTVSTGLDLSPLARRMDPAAVSERNAITDTTARFKSSMRFAFGHVVSIGAELTRLATDSTIRTDATEPGAGLGVPPAKLSSLLERAAHAQVVTVAAEDNWRPLARLTVTPGLRIMRDDGVAATYLLPRVGASYEITPLVHLRAEWSVDRQAATRITREDRAHGDGEFWTLADGATVPLPRTHELAAGLTAEVGDASVAARMHYRALDQISLFASRAASPAAAAGAGTLFHEGSGTSAALEFRVEHRAGRSRLATQYRLSHAEYTFPTLESGVFPASEDRLHELSIVDSVRVWRSWTVGAAFLAASGRPYTPVQSVETLWFPTGDLRYRAAFAATNSGRLPPYHRLDVSSDVARRLGAVTATVGGTVFNVYDRKNMLRVDYDTAGPAAVSSDVMMMGRGLNVRIRVSF